MVGLLSSSVYAQSDLYFGIGFNDITSKHAINIGQKYPLVFKYRKINYKALIGKRLSDSMAIELQYADSAKERQTMHYGTASIISNVVWRGSSIGVAGLYHFNPQSDSSPFVKLGVHSWDVGIVNTNTGMKAETNGIDVFLWCWCRR